MSNAFWDGISQRAINLKATAQNSFWVISGKLIIFLLGFAFVTGLANLVPKGVVGSYNYIIAVLTIASITTLPGMNGALTRAVARGFEGSIKPMMRLKFLYGLLGSAISLVFGLFYLAHGHHMLGTAFLIAAPFVPMTDTYSEMAYSFFQGRKNFKKTMFLAVICQIIFSIPSFIILFFTHNLIIISSSFFVFQTIGGLLVYTIAKPANNLRDHESEKMGLHLTLIGIPRIVAFNIDTIIVFAATGPVAAAIYTFAFTPMAKLEQLIPIDMLSLPNLSEQQPTSENKKKLWRRTFLLIGIMIPVIAIGWFLAPIVFHILFRKFPESVHLFRILLLTLLTTPFILLKTSFVAWNKKYALTINEFVSPTLRIILMAILGFSFGALGVVIGIVIARFVEAIIIGSLFANAT